MGDRFVCIRADSHIGREESGAKAIKNIGQEEEMREELAGAIADVVENIDVGQTYDLTEDEQKAILDAANIISLARTAVELDYRGDVVDAHAPEMPTRLAKQLTQVTRGALAIGLSHEVALSLALRVACDSMPQLRLDVLRDVAAHADSPIIDVRRRLQKPRATIDRMLQALHFLGLLKCDEKEEKRGDRTEWKRYYSLADGIRLDAIT